ncbi:MAG: hypothetical protein MUP63_03905 [Candidatus Nanohaloarchaeota archaeon QJJ-7]|nr:hypothetical protein [Candidatus Nanohaloarchaeota archaeon QJJ-7]
MGIVYEAQGEEQDLDQVESRIYEEFGSEIENGDLVVQKRSVHDNSSLSIQTKYGGDSRARIYPEMAVLEPSGKGQLTEDEAKVLKVLNEIFPGEAAIRF